MRIKPNNVLTFIILITVILMISCKKNGGNPKVLEGILLVSPPDSELCNASLLESGKMLVKFEWTIQGDYEGEYTMVYTNTVNGATDEKKVQGNQNFVVLNLNPGIRYQWNITAFSNGRQVKADKDFTLVTPGLQTESYPPYLSDIKVVNKQDDNYEITFTAIDPDGDDLLFDIYLDNYYPPTNLIAEELEVPNFPVSLNSMSNYYIKVVAKDATGNFTSLTKAVTTE